MPGPLSIEVILMLFSVENVCLESTEGGGWAFLYETDNNLTADTSLDPTPQEVVTQGEIVNGLKLVAVSEELVVQCEVFKHGSVQSTHNEGTLPS